MVLGIPLLEISFKTGSATNGDPLRTRFCNLIVLKSWSYIHRSLFTVLKTRALPAKVISQDLRLTRLTTEFLKRVYSNVGMIITLMMIIIEIYVYEGSRPDAKPRAIFEYTVYQLRY